MTTQTLSAERARELFSYDPETGALRWRVTRRGVRAGRIAGHAAPDGYILVRADQVLYKAHRIAWLIYFAEWPNGQIDHIDGNPGNNRLSNLRDVSPTVNQQNKRQATRQSSTGVLGVFPSRGRFISRIRDQGKPTHLGVFDTPEEAHQVYLHAKRALHVGCTI